MSKAKAFALLAITLLLFQLYVPSIGTVADSLTHNIDDKSKVDVNTIEQEKDVIKWEVVINAETLENDGIKTVIEFGEGLTHSNYVADKTLDITKTKNGYEILTPAGDATYTVEINTIINDASQMSYQLQAKSDYGETSFKASSQIVVNEVIDEEIQIEEEKNNVIIDEIIDEQTTDEAVDEDNKGNQKEKNEEIKIKEEVGVASQSIFSATSNPIALQGQQPGANWPVPGSLNLNKQASATSQYNEWEVELNVKGKNLKTSSDIVIVFDRSNSMSEGNRATKAKQAAKDFINNLQVNEHSTVRIAIVPFGSESGTANDPITDFEAYDGKGVLLQAIDNINIYTTHASGGTNIHAGLHQADLLLNGSTADQKTIVLMSDGEPTYSIKAGGYTKPYSWSNNKYDFILKDFDYSTRVGTGMAGNSPNYGWNSYACGSWLFPKTCYDPHVNDHVIPTISEAKYIMDSGIDIYSIGLEVGNVPDAIYTLKNSQNKGYYAGGSDDMQPIFDEIAARLAYAATNAIVTDPLGEMFDLIKDRSYNGENFTTSHGNVTWDDTTDTITWDIGNVKEDEVYTLKYKVKLDCSKDPQAEVEYPTNKKTPLNYTDYNGVTSTKQFPIPKVSIDKGKIDKIGYRVNVNGDPVDSNGDVVVSPAEAEILYKENVGKELALNTTYSVEANDVPAYQLHVGEDPTEVELTTNICTTVWFGYVKITELPAGKVTAKYVDEAGNEIAAPVEFTGNIGEDYSTEQKNIPGYEFVEIHVDSANPTGTFTSVEQTVIYVYKQLKGTIKIIKVDADDANLLLKNAEFELRNEENEFVGIGLTNEAGEYEFIDVVIGDYTLVEIHAPEGYRLLKDPIAIEITSEELNITKTIKNSKQDWVIPKTGGIGMLGFYVFGIILIGVALTLIVRRRRT